MTTPLELFPLDHLWDQAFTRIAGAPARAGNRVNLLRDAAENYPAWLEAIGATRAWVHFESYIIHDDTIGRQFADALEAKARSGVSVRAVLQLATPREPARLDESRSSQDDPRRWTIESDAWRGRPRGRSQPLAGAKGSLERSRTARWSGHFRTKQASQDEIAPSLQIDISSDLSGVEVALFDE